MIQIPTNIKNKKLVIKRREQLIKSGIKLFSQKGFHGTKLSEIAEDAGISYGNIYDYVGCKEDIFYLIHDFLYQRSIDLFNRSVEGLKDPLERLRAIIGCEFRILDNWSEATLLMYQEAHILNSTYLKELLKRERHRLEKIEVVIAECVEKEVLTPCNVRLTANLIKSMLDAWVLKGWDLQGHASRKETEQAMIDILLNGLLKDKRIQLPKITNDLESNCAFIGNGGTELGKALCGFLLEKGLRVIAYIENQLDRNQEHPSSMPGSLCLYTSDKNGPLNSELIEYIEQENGPIDVYFHDIGVGNTTATDNDPSLNNNEVGFYKNLLSAKKALIYIRKAMAQRRSGRIVFIAPWAWDQYPDSIEYETAKASTMAMTQVLSKELGAAGVNVNCIVPGFIRSLRPSPIEKELSEKIINEISCGHLGEVQDILDAALFLITGGSRHITGEVLNICGGKKFIELSEL